MTQSNHSHSKEKKRRKMTHWTKARTISNRANTKSCKSMCSPWDLEMNHVSCKGLGSLLSATLLPEAHTLTVLCQCDSMCAAILSRCLMVLTPPTHWGINCFTFIVSYQVLSEPLCMVSELAIHYLAIHYLLAMIYLLSFATFIPSMVVPQGWCWQVLLPTLDVFCTLCMTIVLAS